MKTFSLAILIALNSFSLIGQAEKSDFELELSRYSKQETKESFVNIDGSIYRKIELEGSFYYLRLMQPNNPVIASDLHCTGQIPIPGERPFLVEAEVKVTQRTKVFIEGLKVSCSGKPSPEIRIGFAIPDSFLPKLKNKKLFINPLGGVGFYGQF